MASIKYKGQGDKTFFPFIYDVSPDLGQSSYPSWHGPRQRNAGSPKLEEEPAEEDRGKGGHKNGSLQDGKKVTPLFLIRMEQQT